MKSSEKIITFTVLINLNVLANHSLEIHIYNKTMLKKAKNQVNDIIQDN